MKQLKELFKKIEKKKEKSPVIEIVNYYYNLKGLDKMDKAFWQKHKEQKYSYARNAKDAKILLKSCDGSFYKAIEKLYNEHSRSKYYNNYDWRISTVYKRLKNDSSEIKNKATISKSSVAGQKIQD